MISESLLIAGVTGVVSAIATVAALQVHITYLTAATLENKRSILRAHDRITIIEKRCIRCRNHENDVSNP
jgi:hypothetical protein